VGGGIGVVINFPDSPSVGDEITVDTKTYVWDGVVWDRKFIAPPTDMPGAPTLTSVVPSALQANGAKHTIEIIGTGYTPDTVLFSDNVETNKVFVSETKLTTNVTAPLIDAMDEFKTRNTAISNELPLAFNEPPNRPIVNSIAPESVWNNWTTLDIVISGQDFLPETKATWDGAAQDNTVFNSPVSIQFNINPSLLPTGLHQVGAITQTLGSTATKTFTINF
jgi:hypothetical protein